MFVISGATGRTGAAAASGLLEAGHDVRVLVRTDDSARLWTDRGAEAVIADFTDGPAMKTAMKGASGAYLMTPPLASAEDLLAERVPIETNMIEAVLAADLRHVVILSAFAAHLSAGTGQIVGLHRMEDRFANAGISFTSLRAAFFMENWAPVLAKAVTDGVLPSFVHPLDRKIEQVSTADIGRAAMRALTNPISGQRYVSVAGPEAISASDVALTIAGTIERAVNPVALAADSWDAIWAGLDWSEDRRRLYAEFFASINDGTAAFDPADELWRGKDSIANVAARMLNAG